MVDKENYIGKRLEIDEIRKLFPNKWAIVKDYTDSVGGFVVDGVLVEVLDFNDMLEYMKNHTNDKLYRFRTTENFNVGYLHGELIKSEDI